MPILCREEEKPRSRSLTFCFINLYHRSMSEKQISPNAPSETSNATKNIEAGLAGFILPLVLIIIIFVSLNYFSILPISESVPFLSFLPKQKTQKVEAPSKTMISPTQTLKPKVTFGCPVKESLCAKGAILILAGRDETSSFSGIVYSSLPEGTEILSSFAGDIQVKNLATEGATLVTIINKDANLQANYKFPKDAFKLSIDSVRAGGRGETIGTIINGSKNFKKLGAGYDNLIFSIQNFSTKSYIKIKPAGDGKFILSI